MKKILELISEEMQKAFEEAGYNKELGKVTISNRPDLCEYQCNGAMAGAKQYKKAPIMIANEVVEKLADSVVNNNIVDDTKEVKAFRVSQVISPIYGIRKDNYEGSEY